MELAKFVGIHEKGETCRVLSLHACLTFWWSLMKAEAFFPPDSSQAAKGAQYIADYHGFAGPVQVTYPDDMYGGPQQKAFADTIKSITGIKHFKDLNGGNPNCVSTTPLSMDHHSDHRSSSVQAYLTPVEGVRMGWTTLTDHMVRLR